MAKIRMETGMTFTLYLTDLQTTVGHCILIEEYEDQKEGRTVKVRKIFTEEGIFHYDEEEAQLYPTPQKEEECWVDVLKGVLDRAHENWNGCARRCEELEIERDKLKKQVEEEQEYRKATIEQKDHIIDNKNAEIRGKEATIDEYRLPLIELRKAFSSMTGNPYPRQYFDENP